MKISIPLILLIALGSIQLSAQDNAQRFEAKGEYYQIHSYISQEHAESMAVQLDVLFDFFNSYFHFDPHRLPAPLQVRIYGSQQEYAEYTGRYVGDPQEDYVYLHYSDPQRSELIGYQQDSPANRQALSHQGFIQFLRGFIPNPPLWIREGFAVYFEHSHYDHELNTVAYRENLSWLETLKSDLEPGLFQEFSVQELLTMTTAEAQEYLEEFYPRSWGLVSFLLHSPAREYNRALWDSISALNPNYSLNDNSQAVVQNAFQWLDADTLTEDFHFYIDTRQSFRSLVQQGIQLYSQDSHDRAEQQFIQALNLQDSNYIPYYYLGLINYARGNYTLADSYYSTALELGADEPVTLYAMGVNAYADQRPEDAVELLENAVTLDPEGYRERVEQLIERIREEA